MGQEESYNEMSAAHERMAHTGNTTIHHNIGQHSMLDESSHHRP